MSTAFDPTRSPVVIEAWVSGPASTGRLRLAVDTGCTGTLVSETVLRALGVDVPAAGRRRRIRSATGGVMAPVATVRQLLALGHARTDFPVTAHDLPPAVGYHGLLGVDFFRGLVLTVDFARGRVSLRPPRAWWRVWG